MCYQEWPGHAFTSIFLYCEWIFYYLCTVVLDYTIEHWFNPPLSLQKRTGILIQVKLLTMCPWCRCGLFTLPGPFHSKNRWWWYPVYMYSHIVAVEVNGYVWHFDQKWDFIIFESHFFIRFLCKIVLKSHYSQIRVLMYFFFCVENHLDWFETYK